MARRPAPHRTDGNQQDIMRALRRAGCSCTDTHEVGHGFVDLVVGRVDEKGVPRTYLLEVKSPGGTLTDDERCWRQFWKGQMAVVHDEIEALRAVGLGVGDEAPA